MSNVYRNDGSGRDSYVNAASMSQRQRMAVKDPKAKASFWPDNNVSRERGNRDKLDATLSPTTRQPLFRQIDPTERTSFKLEALLNASNAPGAYESPRRNQSPQRRVCESLSSLSTSPVLSNNSSVNASPSPSRIAGSAQRCSSLETTTMAQMRTGRFSLPSLAPLNDGKLHLKRSQTVGVLDEI